MDRFTKELDTIEAERQKFMAHHHQLAERTTLLSYDELRILEGRWIEKIDGQWRPILSFVERNLDRKESLQSMLDSDHGKGSSVLNGRTMVADVDSKAHVQEHGYVKCAQGSNVDPASVLLAWKRSLQLLETKTSRSRESSAKAPSNHTGPLNDLSSSHSLQLQRIRGSRQKLEIRLQEASKRVERLKSATQEAIACSRSIARCLGPSANDGSFSDEVQSIRDTLGASGSQTKTYDRSSHRGLREALGGRDAHLMLSAEVVADRAVASKPVLAASAIPSKSIFQRLGASKKRRQSSDFDTRRYIPSVAESHDPLQETPLTPDRPQQTKRVDIFDSGLQEPPETPSKRTKIDSFEIDLVGRRTTGHVELKTPVKERSVNNNLVDTSVPSSPSSRVLDRKRTLAVRSPKLTLDDLRAPTPKPMKISSTDGPTAGLKMPIMFLHTPQQKKLYEMLAETENPKLSRPFNALTPPSKSDDKFGRISLSPKTPLKPSPFTSSIFTRFKTSSGLQRAEGRPLGLAGSTVPKSPSTSGLFLLDSPRAATSEYPTSPLANKRPTRPLAASVRVNHLLTGNSVALDRICNSDNGADRHSHTLTVAQVEPKENKLESVQITQAQTVKIPSTSPEKLMKSDRKTEAVTAQVDLRAS
ncbi:hypothetical protein BGZ70_000945, partial [Mortierella alpina]